MEGKKEGVMAQREGAREGRDGGKERGSCDSERESERGKRWRGRENCDPERERERIPENMFDSSIVAGHHYSGCLHLSWTRHPGISGTWR